MNFNLDQSLTEYDKHITKIKNKYANHEFKPEKLIA